MAHYGALRDYRFSDMETEDDVRGSHVYGVNDEKIGKIDDVIFDHSTGGVRYVVVDAGGWLSSEKFILSPERFTESPKHKHAFQIGITKQQIEKFPPYDPESIEHEDTWADYERRYKASWHEGPVLHREGSDHDITPTPDEMPEEPGSIGSQLSPREQAELSSRIIPAGADELTLQNSAMGIGGRWLNFENRLRQHRRDITNSCTTCTVGPASDRSSGESATQERKAV